MQIVYFPDEVLSKPCVPVTEFDEGLKDLVENMRSTMYASKGVGIAAPQVGVSKCVIIVDPDGDADVSQSTFVNPKILWSSKETVGYSEGCLSIPSVFVSVERPECIEVEYQALDGQKRVEKFGGWAARILQHEVDHLSGIVMFDRIDKDTRATVLECYTTSIQRLHTSATRGLKKTSKVSSKDVNRRAIIKH